MNIEEEIARIVDAEFDDYAPRYSEAGECVGSNVAAALMPLVKRAQAEALREAADEIGMRRNEPGLVKLDVQYAGYYTGIRSGMESAVRAIRNRIEQEGAGA